MKVVGYSDRLSVAPGEQIRFMVSSELPRYRAELVRLIHGDVNPAGPGFKEARVPAAIDGEYAGRPQRYPRGSAVLVGDRPELSLDGSFTLQAWIWPTTPAQGSQGILTKWDADARVGVALALDRDGELALWLGRSGADVQRLGSGVPLRARQWYFVAASFDAASGRALLVQRAYPAGPRDGTGAAVEDVLGPSAASGCRAPFAMAAYLAGWEHDRPRLAGHFNGKLEAPRVYGEALDLARLEALWRGEEVSGVSPLAAWDFVAETSSSRIVDRGLHGLHGEALQMPARAMTGHAYRGIETDWRHAPAEYGAIHFHEDDLVDAEWEVAFTLTVPDDLPSGVYAAKLIADAAEDYVPFFVRPKDRKASAKALWLVPTNSYLAYANIHALDNPALRQFAPPGFEYPVQEQDKYAIAERLHSLYDKHSDGSGVCYSSHLRPVVNLRPKVIDQLLDDGRGAPHQFNEDLCLVDWLEAEGVAFDVATDEDLHTEGANLLDQYRVVLTGSHHEYWSLPMLDALEEYLGQGGRLMYLSGNGLYWVTSFAPGRPQVIEVRRWGGTQAWTAVPGEYHHSTTGELGGLWRERQRAPQRYVGVGFTSQGIDRGRAYRRQPGSFDPRAAWIFDGVGPDEPIGDFGLVVGAAAGHELDRADASLGTPPHALVLATATGFSDSYQYVVEEVEQSDSKQGGTVNPLVRADLVFFETPNGGAVFSTGSISYCGSLSHNNYDNNVSRITMNVLRRFLDDRPFA